MNSLTQQIRFRKHLTDKVVYPKQNQKLLLKVHAHKHKPKKIFKRLDDLLLLIKQHFDTKPSLKRLQPVHDQPILAPIKQHLR